MNKVWASIFLVFLIFVFPNTLEAQVVDRYPFVQIPTETSVLIAWRTDASQTGILTWGDSPTTLNDSLTDSSPTQRHAHTIEGLEAGTRYYYQVWNIGGDSSEVEYFYTAKPMPVEQVSFLHYGDCGYNNQIQKDIAALMEAEDVDFAVVAGDVDQGDGSNYDDVFFGVYRDMLKNECHYTALGNHDIIYDNGATYLDAFYLPTNNPQQTEQYYTFTWGNAKFIAMDSNIDYSPGSDQHNFLLDELKCNEHHWLFVFFHHPPWTNAWDPLYYVPLQPFYQYDGNDDMRTDLVPYFEQYGVDFVLNGHSHCYQAGSLNGVNYVISGGAGSALIDQHTCNTFPSFNNCSPNIQKELFTNHFVRFNISGDTISYDAIDQNGQVIDSYISIKSSPSYQLSLTSTAASGSSSNDGEVQVSISGPNAPYGLLWSTGDTAASVLGLNPGTYYLTITNANGCAKTDSVVVSGPVGLEEETPLLSDLQVFPVPFAEAVHFSWHAAGHAVFNLQLRDLQGRLVAESIGKGGFVSLQTEHLAPGVYFYLLLSEGKLVSGKVLK